MIVEQERVCRTGNDSVYADAMFNVVNEVDNQSLEPAGYDRERYLS